MYLSAETRLKDDWLADWDYGMWYVFFPVTISSAI
jgi:hypothetical protein